MKADILDQKFGRHLFNAYDPRRCDASLNHVYLSFDQDDRKLEWEYYLKLVETNRIGPPQATDQYTTTELQAMGMVGIYAPT